MAMLIPIAHDFICPWCYLGLLQAEDLERQYGVEFEWRSYEILPEGMEYPQRKQTEEPPDKPSVPTRFQLACAAQGVQWPTNRGPSGIRSHKAHEAVEFIRTEQNPSDFVADIYRAYYEQAADIDNADVVLEIAKAHTKNLDELRSAIETKRYADKIVAFDEPSYETGIYNVPTFYIAGERYAEQPYVALEKAVKDALVPA